MLELEDVAAAAELELDIPGPYNLGAKTVLPLKLEGVAAAAAAELELIELLIPLLYHGASDGIEGVAAVLELESIGLILPDPYNIALELELEDDDASEW